jgi:hypothetical protein
MATTNNDPVRMITLREGSRLRRTYRYRGVVYGPQSEQVPYALAGAMGLIGDEVIPTSDESRKAPAATGQGGAAKGARGGQDAKATKAAKRAGRTSG